MNFSEFKALLGAEPRSQDPEFLRARQSSAEFEQAAAKAEQFEDRLERAVLVPAPDGFLQQLSSLSRRPAEQSRERRRWPMALAASVLIAVGAAGLTWNMNRGWDSVEEYVMDHYRHDGHRLMNMDGAGDNEAVPAFLAELNVEALPALAAIVDVIKYCPTPDGKGVHMILNTDNGPVTVLYMPETRVTDNEILVFDDVHAVLVELQKGSAAIIAPDQRFLSALHTLVRSSIVPVPGKS